MSQWYMRESLKEVLERGGYLECPFCGREAPFIGEIKRQLDNSLATFRCSIHRELHGDFSPQISMEIGTGRGEIFEINQENFDEYFKIPDTFNPKA